MKIVKVNDINKLLTIDLNQLPIISIKKLIRNKIRAKIYCQQSLVPHWYSIGSNLDTNKEIQNYGL
ncbi:MAG: hypothetical protein FWF56_04800 [Firmicutes bacterium]|nr:hypothetical protein [Bacillota bacterium]MCL1953296.1 hypothetical protein [Bacillota bacterium]